MTDDAPLAGMPTIERGTDEKLAETTRFLERTVANLSEAVLVVGHGADTRIIREANRAAEQIFGWSREELLGSCTEMLHVSREVYERFGLESLTVLSRGGVYRGEHPMLRKDGSVFEAHQTVAFLDPAAGLAGGSVSVIRDVSEQVRAERALRESEVRFREIAEHVQDVFWVMSGDGRTIEYVSPTFARIWGRDPEEFQRNPDTWRESIHPDDAERVIAALDRQYDGGYAEEYRIVTPDGSVRWIWDRAFPVRDEDGTLRRVIGVAGDVTERRLLEERLRQAQRMEAIGRLAGGVAHDFNNLLTVIVAQADLLLVDGPEASDFAEDLALIRGAADRGADLTRQLLAFSREQVMEPREVDVGEVVEKLQKLLKRLVGAQVRLEVICEDGVPGVYVDPTQLEQVVVNLVVNACDAMPHGGTVSVTVREEWVDRSTASRLPDLHEGRYVTLSVSDDGEGMDEATMARVFDPFFTTRRDSGGTGLGLATSYGIVRQSGGAIHVESSPGLGSTFVVRLPVE